MPIIFCNQNCKIVGQKPCLCFLLATHFFWPQHEPGNESVVNPSPARLLIIDDDAPQTNVLRDFLRPHNYETVGVTTAKDGLVALRESKFDLLLADLSMAEVDDLSFSSIQS